MVWYEACMHEMIYGDGEKGCGLLTCALLGNHLLLRGKSNQREQTLNVMHFCRIEFIALLYCSTCSKPASSLHLPCALSQECLLSSRFFPPFLTFFSFLFLSFFL